MSRLAVQSALFLATLLAVHALDWPELRSLISSRTQSSTRADFNAGLAAARSDCNVVGQCGIMPDEVVVSPRPEDYFLTTDCNYITNYQS